MKTVPRPHLAPPTLLAALLAFALPLADPTLSSAAPAQTADGAAHDGAAVGAESPDDGKHDPPAGDGQEMRHNTLTEKERAEGWRLLFDGRSLQGWRRYDGGEMTAGWLVEDGALAHSGGGFDIIYDEVFDDFELVLDWKVEPAGNSGIFYRAADLPQRSRDADSR